MSRFLNIAAVMSGQAAAVPWYLAGGVPPANCLGAYDAFGAISYADSLINLEKPGVSNLTEGTNAPAWASGTGWTFNNSSNTPTTWLDTGIIPVSGYSFIVQIANTSELDRFICGSFLTDTALAIDITSTSVNYWSGPQATRTPVARSGVFAISGNQPYRNGSADGATISAWARSLNSSFCLGKLNGYNSIGFAGEIRKAALYNTALTPAQILAITNAIIDSTNIMVAFGDSITQGSGATDAAHRWANIVATAIGYTLVNDGIGSTILQNTTSASNNGRDTYTTRVNPHAPGKVYILYGLNDLRLDSPVTSAAFEIDLGEVVDGLIANGTPAKNIIIGSPPYIPETSYTNIAFAPYNAGSRVKHADYTAACAAVATAKGTKYADVYQYMTDNGGDTLISVDGIHPNDAGHAAIAAAFLGAV